MYLKVNETNGSTGHATLNGDGRQQFRRSGRRRTWWGFAPVAVAGQQHKPKRELVNIFVGDTAHLRVSGKSVCHFLQDFLTGGSGTGFEKEWILLKKRFFALQNKEKKLGK